jgi:hypothetical protein
MQVLHKPIRSDTRHKFIRIAGALLPVVMPQRKGERIRKPFVIGQRQFSVFVWAHDCLSCRLWSAIGPRRIAFVPYMFAP